MLALRLRRDIGSETDAVLVHGGVDLRFDVNDFGFALRLDFVIIEQGLAVVRTCSEQTLVQRAMLTEPNRYR